MKPAIPLLDAAREVEDIPFEPGLKAIIGKVEHGYVDVPFSFHFNDQ